MRYHVLARGWNWTSVLALGAAVLGAWLLANISVQLRSAGDYSQSGLILDRLILVGLALPVVVMARQLENRAAWMFASGARSRVWESTRYIVVLTSAALGVGAGLALLSAQPGFVTLVFADFVFLLALAVISTVLFGAEMSWVAPVVAAVASSTPGLMPIAVNILVQQESAGRMMALACSLLAAGAVAFCAFDDYGLVPRRLLSRQPGVTDD